MATPKRTLSGDIFKQGPKKRTSIGDGLRKRAGYKARKRYRGQGK
jgi:hypothetical protein